MRTAKLGELLVPAKVRRAGESDFPILSITMRDGLVNQEQKFKKRIAGKDLSNYKVVSRGQLVVGFPIDEGVLDFQELYDEAIVSPAYGVWDLQDESAVDRGYLKRFLRSEWAIAYYTAKLRSTTARRRSITQADFLAMPVPLPPAKEQRRIVLTIAKAEETAEKQQLLLQQLDDLKASLFWARFRNFEGPFLPLIDVCKGKGSYGATVESTEHVPDLPRYVRITDIDEHGNLSDYPRSPGGQESDWARFTLQYGDFLFARSGATVGKTYRYDEGDGECVFAGYLIKFSLETDLIHPDFLMQFTKTEIYKRWVEERQRAVAQPNINAKQFGQELVIPVPPIEAQKSYVEELSEIDEVWKTTRSSWLYSQLLLKSLYADIFGGGL